MSETIDNNKLYRVLVIDTRGESDRTIELKIKAAMTEGYGPSQISWSPDGVFMIYTMVNAAEATAALAASLVEAGAMGGGYTGNRGGFGIS